MNARATLALCVTLAGGGLGSGAAAQEVVAPSDAIEAHYPLTNTQRPLTLNAGLLRLDVGLDFSQACLALSGVSFCSDILVALNVGAGLGVTDDLEIGAVVLPLLVSPDLDYGDPSIYAVYRFVRGDTDIGVRADISIPVHGSFRSQLGIPVWFKASTVVALRTGAFLTLMDTDATRADEFVVGASVPLLTIISTHESLWVGVDTGLSFQFSDPGSTLAIPFGLQLGYPVPDAKGATFIDIIGSFGFPWFLVPGSDGEVFFTDFWTASIGARLYLELP